MITGFAVTILWVVFAKESFYNLYEMLPVFCAGLAATIVVSLVTTPPARPAGEFDEVWAVVGRPLAGPAPGDERPARAAASGRTEWFLRGGPG